MKKSNFKAALAAVFFVLSGIAFAQQGSGLNIGEGSLISANVWALFRQAEFLLDAGNRGEAFVLVEEARRVHAGEISKMAGELRRAASSREVSRAGDRIKDVYPVLVAREEFAASRAIDRILSRRTEDFFGGSFSALVSWLEKTASLPEADVFTGIVYESDGEASMALSFYERAWKNRNFFDVPGDKITLAYRMADLAGFSGNEGARENYLLLAIADDPVFGTPGKESQALKAMVRTAQEDVTSPQGSASGVSSSAAATSPAFVKFFTLYRNNNPQGLKAYRELAQAYLESDAQIERALPAAVLSAVTAFTLLENALNEYESEYSFSSFGDTLIKASKHREIVAWASTEKIWDSFLQLGTALMRVGASDFAVSLWLNLSLSCPDRAVSEKAAGLMNLTTQNVNVSPAASAQ